VLNPITVPYDEYLDSNQATAQSCSLILIASDSPHLLYLIGTYMVRAIDYEQPVLEEC